MNLIKKRDITPNFFNSHFNIQKKNLQTPNKKSYINDLKIQLYDFNFIYQNEKLYVYGNYTKNKSNQYQVNQQKQKQPIINYYFKNMLYIDNLIISKCYSKSHSLINLNNCLSILSKKYMSKLDDVNIQNLDFNLKLYIDNQNNLTNEQSIINLHTEHSINHTNEQCITNLIEPTKENIIDEYVIVQNEPIVNEYIQEIDDFLHIQVTNNEPIVNEKNIINWFGIELVNCCPIHIFKNYKEEYKLYQLLISIDIIHYDLNISKVLDNKIIKDIERDINQFKLYLIDEIIKNISDVKKKNKIIKNLKENIITDELLQFICNHFFINIIYNDKLYINEVNFCLTKCKYIIIHESLACYHTFENSFKNLHFKNAIKKFFIDKINPKIKLEYLRFYSKLLYKGFLNEINENFDETICMKSKKKYIDKCIEIINSF